MLWLRPLPTHPFPTPSARDGAEPAVCYGVSPPSADRTPPVCFDKAPRCPAGRSLAVAAEEGGRGGEPNVKSCQSSAITKRKWQEGAREDGEKKKTEQGESLDGKTGIEQVFGKGGKRKSKLVWMEKEVVGGWRLVETMVNVCQEDK